MNYFVFALLFAVASASHFRYGTVSSIKDPSNPLKVTYKIDVGFRRSAFFGQNPGQTLDYAASFQVENSYYDYSPVISNVDAANDISYASLQITHTFSSAGTKTAVLSSCCRIGELNNAPGDSWAVNSVTVITSAEVAKTSTVNNSPVASVLPIVNVPYGVVPYQFQLLAVDPEGQTLAYGLATQSEMQAGYSQFQPAGLSISSTGVVTLSQLLALGKYSTQQKITDSFGNVVHVDYIIQLVQGKKACTGICASSTPPCTTNAQCASACTPDNSHPGYTTTNGPQCVDPLPEIFTVDTATNPGAPKSTNLPAPANGATVNAPSGKTTVISFVADDANFWVASSPVVMAFGALPARATASSQTSCNSASSCSCVGCNSQPQLVTITYNPIDADIGPHAVCLSVTSLGVALPYSQHCVTLNVVPGSFCGNGQVDGTEQCDGTLCCDSDCNLSTAACSGTDFCKTVSHADWTYGQGYYCSNNNQGFIQCWGEDPYVQSAYQNCAAGTQCSCNDSRECSQHGTITPCADVQ